LYDVVRLPTSVVISSSWVGARRKRVSFRSWNRKTSEPSVSRPDCSQSSCDDIEDRETLDAPGHSLAYIIGLFSHMPSYPIHAYACQSDPPACPALAVQEEVDGRRQSRPITGISVLVHISNGVQSKETHLSKKSTTNQEVIGILWYLLAFGQSLGCNWHTIDPRLLRFTSSRDPKI
jgi:hypothetical protein